MQRDGSTYPDEPELSSLSRMPGSEDPLLKQVAGVADTPGGTAGGCASTPLPGDVIDGKYRLQRLLGRGGMGWVFEAIHLQTDKKIALKYLRPDLPRSEAWLARLAREARAAGKIDHPNVIRIYDVGGVGPDMYIVMEYLHGETLRSRLQRGPLPHEEALPLMLAVMRGVAEAHRLGVVHRDLKPENIFLCTWPDGQTGTAKILDFGVSKIVDRGAELALDRTSARYAGGTPLYMPLEQLQRAATDARADVYALGVVLYEVLSGSHPFSARTRDELVAALANRPVPCLPRGVHPRAALIDSIIGRALARYPHDRYASVPEFAAALEALVGSDAAPQKRPQPRWTWLLAASVVLFSTVPTARPAGTRAPTARVSSAMIVPARATERDLTEPSAALCEEPQAPPQAGGAHASGEASSDHLARTVADHGHTRDGRARKRAGKRLASAPSADDAHNTIGRALTIMRADF